MATDFETSKLAVQRLIEKYKQVVASGRIKDYKEENTKKDFITPLFRALGWDTENDNSPDEVTNEDQISRGRVDYAFRMNGIPKFFLEAKALNKGLDESKDAQQAINYAWYKGTSWAVLTDFKTLVIYNAEVKGRISDAQFIRLECDQFADQFQKLWWLSKLAFKEGLLDKEATSWGKKLRKIKVGEQLLAELMSYRQLLSKNIVKNNAARNLSESDLDETVQRMIDRLIFIRTTEDRGIEEKHLVSIAREFEGGKKGRMTTKLNELYLAYDKTYNSKLFTFNPDNLEQRHLCETLEIDNEALLKVLNGLYRSNDGLRDYDFSAIDADVLGNIYEQYLSHILSKTSKRAKVEMEEAHRHDQGIYYTPTYVVDYIVRNTLSELLKGKKTADVEKIRVLDMACGSGSFLLKAFDVINDFYRAKDKNYAQTGLDAETAEFRITRKTKILRENIYGVDLDPKAVEIAQLNLLLKAAETKHLLPDLRNNIKCGNSLVSQMTLEDAKAFDWQKEFSEIISSGGFDVIIGNPPYVRQEELTDIKPYLEANYEVYQGTADLFVYFFERELKMLKEGGYFGMIVSNKWFKAGYGAPLRKFLSKFWIEQVVDFGDLPVFADATTYPCIIIIRKISKANPKIRVCLAKTLQFDSLENYVRKISFQFDQKKLTDDGWNFKNTETIKILEKIKQNTISLKEYAGGEVYRGILTGLNKVFVINEETKNKLIAEDPKNAEIIKPFLIGNEIRRYGIEPKGKYLIFTRRGIEINKYPVIKKYLYNFESELTPKRSQSQNIGRKPGDYAWYEIQDTIAYYKEFEKPKIVYGKITTGPRFTLDLGGRLTNDSTFFIPCSDKKLLAILNSKIGWFLTANICTEIRGGYQLIWKYFGNIPIVKQTAPELEGLVDKMLKLNEKLLSLKGKHTDEGARIEQEIAETDAKIDQLVYKLYGITEEEKKIIEGRGH